MGKKPQNNKVYRHRKSHLKIILKSVKLNAVHQERPTRQISNAKRNVFLIEGTLNSTISTVLICNLQILFQKPFAISTLHKSKRETWTFPW